MMPTEPCGKVKASLQDTLTTEHERLDALFERLLAAFRADARSELGPLWAEFDSRLRAHLALEEEHILPELAKLDPGEASALTQEHVHVRALLTELDVAIDLHLCRERTMVELIALLRAHAKREDVMMYRWAAANLSPTKQHTIREAIRRTFAKVLRVHERE